jgi:hypothetical protein
MVAVIKEGCIKSADSALLSIVSYSQTQLVLLHSFTALSNVSLDAALQWIQFIRHEGINCVSWSVSCANGCTLEGADSAPFSTASYYL